MVRFSAWVQALGSERLGALPAAKNHTAR